MLQGLVCVIFTIKAASRFTVISTTFSSVCISLRAHATWVHFNSQKNYVTGNGLRSRVEAMRQRILPRYCDFKICEICMFDTPALCKMSLQVSPVFFNISTGNFWPNYIPPLNLANIIRMKAKQPSISILPTQSHFFAIDICKFF